MNESNIGDICIDGSLSSDWIHGQAKCAEEVAKTQSDAVEIGSAAEGGDGEDDGDVHIYVAFGEVYGGDETPAPLKLLFPNIHSKETLASKEKLAPFTSFSSRMAALNFMVCDGSDVFVTNNNDNMTIILVGSRCVS